MRCRATRFARAWLVWALCALPATRARASYEEFSTLDIAKEEGDGETLLDHVLARPPVEWESEWRSSTRGFRSSEGCFTSGEWFIDHELKVRVPMGDTTYLDLGIRQVDDDEASYGWTQFDVRFPLRHAGLWGVRFRPNFDKSNQDMGILWDVGTDLTPFHVQAVMGLEDIFNKFWALRQITVGAEAQPYLRHPYEPALSVAWRGAGPHFEATGKWLTPSRKRFITFDLTQRRVETLWGEKHDATLSQRFGDYTALVRFDGIQASSYAYWEQAYGDHHIFQRRWRGEAQLNRAYGEHARVTLRYFYQDRVQIWRPPIADATLAVIDRLPMIEGAFLAKWDMPVRLGFMRDRVTVVDDGVPPGSTQGDRYETRAFFSLQKRFGRVRIEGTEGIKLDKESYPVTFHHDKGFVHIMTTF